MSQLPEFTRNLAMETGNRKSNLERTLAQFVCGKPVNFVRFSKWAS